MLSFFMPKPTSSLAIIFLSLISVFKFIQKKHLFKNYKGLWGFPVLFIILLVGMFYTAELKEGWKIIERSLSFVIAPIITISILEFNKKQKQQLIDIFIVAGVLASLICLSIATVYYIETGTVYSSTHKGHFIYNHFLSQLLVRPIKMHAIYFSLYLSFINIYILQTLLNKDISSTRKKIYASVFLYFCIFLVLLKSAMFQFLFPLVCLLVLWNVFQKKILGSTKSKLITFMVIGGVSVLAYQGIQSKLESFSLEYNLSDSHLYPLTMRFAMWECSWEAIQQNWLVGTGTGDGHSKLLNTYKEMNFHIGFEEGFNSHNMYLQYWLSNGILSVLLFATIISILFIGAFKARNLVFISLVLFLAGFSITESTMLRADGIIFFTFLLSMFYWEPSLWNFSDEKK